MAEYVNDFDKCDCNIIHEDAVREAREKLLDDDVLMDMADTFKIFSDSTRIKILNALLHRELCVCDIAALLSMTKSSVSHQLRILKQSDLVKYRKDGRVVFYSLADDHVKIIFDKGHEHVTEDKSVRS